jgi:general stress protein 26
MIGMKVNESCPNELKVVEALEESRALVDHLPTCQLATNGDNGYPNIKTMNNMKALLKMDPGDLKNIWFSTNTCSKRVAQLRRDPRAAVYFQAKEEYKGLMLVGKAELLQDHDTRSRFWVEGNEVYYPLGVDDPDYTVIKFTAEWGNYYHRLRNVSFEV